MTRKQFKTTINAPRETVWEVLWGDTTYPRWTAVFMEGSRAETDWKKGSKILFLGGNNEGMVCSIAENIPNEFMSFSMLGTVKNGVEDLFSAQSEGWAGATENYTLKTVDGKTELTVEVDVMDDHIDYFTKTFPLALNKVKEISEGA
jgi:uncharacterized protein YndB with AHSA1/START domain